MSPIELSWTAKNDNVLTKGFSEEVKESKFRRWPTLFNITVPSMFALEESVKRLEN